MASEKIIKLGQKLYALSVQGVGGEQETANKMLTAFLEKYDLQISDVAPEARTRRIIYKVTLDNKQMMVNLVASIVGSVFTANKCRGKGMYATEMNEAEWYNFSERWEIYRLELRRAIMKKRKEQAKEMQRVTTAFIHKHSIFSTDKSDSKSIDDLTKDELEEIYKMLQLTEEFDDINFFKKLN